MRDEFAYLLSQVCHDVKIEPGIQPADDATFQNRSTTTDPNARLDVQASGFWGTRFHRTFFDVKVFNPFAASSQRPVASAYKTHEKQKIRKYAQRLREIDHGSFTPLVFSCTGVAAPQKYPQTISWIRTKISFALLKSAFMCLRGSRTVWRHRDEEPSIALTNRESMTPSAAD